MLITIAVMFIVLATFLLIIVNMFSDYASRRDQDMRIVVTHARNLIAETEELLLNQNQISYSKTLVLVLHYRIIRALRKIAASKVDSADGSVQERIANEEKLIADLKTNYHDDVAFRPPENDTVAMNQLRTIRRLRAILKNELRQGMPIDPSEVQKEDRRLYLLVLKVNISNLVQRVLEMKRLKQLGTCRLLIQKGLDVIHKTNVKDDWIAEKADLLNQLRQGLDAESNRQQKKPEDAKASEEKKEIDMLFGDKKKW
ncbi:MAG: hypothetical protein SOT14_08890 [Succinivibrio sp.]|jgi:hypothetical protein|nr:hypothetical protein [Succinivibrio sp.]